MKVDEKAGTRSQRSLRLFVSRKVLDRTLGTRADCFDFPRASERKQATDEPLDATSGRETGVFSWFVDTDPVPVGGFHFALQNVPELRFIFFSCQSW